MRTLEIDNYSIDTPILEILHRLQITLTNGKLRDIQVKGDNIWVSCPHHNNGQENKPGMTIYIGDDTKIPYGYCGCFVCGFKGSFVSFVAECFSAQFDYGKRWLISNFGVKTYDKQIKLDPIILGKNKYKKEIDKTILDQYQHWCPYLAHRKLSREVCEKFNVRYDSYYRQIIFPCYDSKDRLVMLPKRSIDTKVFYLDKDVEKPVYNLNTIIKNNIKKCMLVEGPIDNLTCWSHNIPAIATLGKPSDTQIANINKSCITILYLAFDNDEAGRAFTASVKSKLDSRILTIDIQLPANRKDVNDLTDAEWQDIITKYNLNYT